MADAPPPPDHSLDVDNRDGQRTPMQWDATGDGFGDDPWLPFAPSKEEVNVERQHDNPDSLLNLYRTLIRYRRDSPVLRMGHYRSVDSSGNTFAYLRSLDDDRLLVVLNFADEPVSTRLPGTPPAGELQMSTHSGRDSGWIDLRPLRLAPCEGVVLRIEERR